MKVRMNSIETKQKEAVQRVETVEAKQVSSDARMDKIEARLNEVATSSGSSKEVWEELKERERRETNIIIHNVPESNLPDKKVVLRRKEERDMVLANAHKLNNCNG